MRRQETDLPFGDAFSPGSLQDEDGNCVLPFVLEIFKEHEADCEEFDQAMADQFYSDSSDPLTTAKNVRLGMKNYELITENYHFIEIGQELYELREDEKDLYDRLAEHILLNLDGVKVMDIIRDLQMAGEQTTTSNIYRELDRQYDIYVDEGSTHWNQMRGWLAEADLINTRTHHIKIDWEKLDRLVGVDRESRLRISGLSEAQQAFLKTLAAINPDKPIPNNEVRDLAEDAHDVYIDHKSTTSDILDPLQDAGFIEYESTVDVTGKASVVSLTDKFDAEVLDPVMENIVERSGVPRSVLRQSFSEIREQMDSDLAPVKGQALEALAIKIGLLLHLNFVGWRVRGTETGGAEVDVVMDWAGVGFTRWQIQCKNTQKRLRTKHVAKEVGLARMLQSNIILMISRSDVVPDAQQYAKKIIRDENLTILFLTGNDLDDLEENPSKLTEAIKKQTQEVHRLKSLTDEPDENSEDND